MSIQLTEEQQKILDAEQGHSRVVDPRSNATYVLLPTETYERLKGIWEGDSQAEEAFQAQIESAAAAGWDDPALDAYNNLDPRRQS